MKINGLIRRKTNEEGGGGGGLIVHMVVLVEAGKPMPRVNKALFPSAAPQTYKYADILRHCLQNC